MDTIVAQSTPVGVSALGVIRTSGSLSVEIARKLFEGSDLCKPREATRVQYKGVNGDVIDDVILIRFEAGHSYTGEDILEIMPHGNPLICQKLIEDLCRRGCRLAGPGEFTRRAYENGRMSISQAEAVADLIHAQSDRAIEMAHRHLSGEAGRMMDGFVLELTRLRAEIEAYIDFPEEELPPEDTAGPLARLKGIMETLGAFRRASANRRLVQDGVNTLIIGAPNAGKSSLLNALVGHSRALVDAQAGTTRDYIVERLWIGPYLVNLFDTAGLRDGAESRLEQMGIDKTMDLMDRSDFVLLVVDSAAPIPDLPKVVLDRLKPGRTLLVENKVDLGSSKALGGVHPEWAHVRVSATEGTGLEALQDRWISSLREIMGDRDSEVLMFNARQAQFIAAADDELTQAWTILKEGSGTELAAFHLIRASEELVQINREIDNEAVLDSLFSHFCIGK